MLYLSNVFYKNRQALKDGFRYIINRGGTSSTKTWSLLHLNALIAEKQDVQIYILGQTVPHLKGGVLNDIPKVCEDLGIDFHNNYGKQDNTLKLKGEINFISVDKIGKALGGRRDILFVNEANRQHWAIIEQMIIRTRIAVFIDYNPTSEFWVHTQLMKTEPEKCIEIVSTYKDNERLEQTIVDALEARKGDNNFWRVFGLGEMGRAEGLIFSDYTTCCMFDKESFKNYRHGVDWGFSRDPFAYVRIAVDFVRMELYVCDEYVGTGLQNTDTAPIVKKFANYEPVFCDSAEPKSIAEYQNLGVNADGVKKGQGSVESGIKFMQRFKVFIHSDCVNTADEFNNYSWKMNRTTGEPMNIPDDCFNHCIDAIRYSLNSDIEGQGIPSITFF